MSRPVLAIAAAACLAASVARAEVTPVAAGPGEARVTVVAFDPDQIVRVRVAPGGVQVVFSPDETQFDVGLSGAWQWDRSQNTLFFMGGAGVKPKIVYVVSSLPGGETRRYQLELIPTDDEAAGVPWQRPPGPMEARTASAQAVSDVLPEGPLPGAASAPVAPAPAVVRFTYAKQEAAAKAEAARKAREEAAARWRATHQAGVASAQQARLGAEVKAAALDAQGRKRCDVMWRGDARLVPRAVCNNGATTTFAYTGMVVPAIFAVGPDGKDQKVMQEPVPGQPGLILVRATSEFWRVRLNGSQVTEFWDASYDPTGIPTTGTDTASPRVRLSVRSGAVRSRTTGMGQP